MWGILLSCHRRLVSALGLSAPNGAWMTQSLHVHPALVHEVGGGEGVEAEWAVEMREAVVVIHMKWRQGWWRSCKRSWYIYGVVHSAMYRGRRLWMIEWWWKWRILGVDGYVHLRCFMWNGTYWLGAHAQTGCCGNPLRKITESG